jgi:hypothetical protein
VLATVRPDLKDPRFDVEYRKTKRKKIKRLVFCGEG